VALKQHEEWSIRVARDRDLASARRIVPNVYTARAAPDRVLIATRTGQNEIAGVAAVAWRTFGTVRGFPLFVQVVEHERRRGLGRALVQAAASESRGETQHLLSWTAFDEASAEAGFARALGFEVARRTLYFEADIHVFFRMIDRIHAQLARRNRIPSNARTVPLEGAPQGAVARLVGEAFDGRHDVALANTLNSGPGGYDKKKSVVLLIDEQVCGALLYRWVDNTPQIDVNVVAPHLRRRWANVALLHHATRNAIEGGARSFRFYCEDTVVDTVNLARRANAPLLHTTLEFAAAVDALANGERT
jgi:GNAT superfamily N-acetyltransferase